MYAKIGERATSSFYNSVCVVNFEWFPATPLSLLLQVFIYLYWTLWCWLVARILQISLVVWSVEPELFVFRFYYDLACISCLLYCPRFLELPLLWSVGAQISFHMQAPMGAKKCYLLFLLILSVVLNRLHIS